MKNPSIALGRPLGAGLVLGFLLLAALAALGASWAALSAVTEERDAKSDLLGRGVAASRRAALDLATPAADPFVSAGTATLAAAAVDAALRTLALDAGLTLLSNRAEAVPEETAAPAGAGAAAGETGTRIEDQAVLEGQNEAVRALLIRLETGTPTMMVDDLALEPADVGESATGDPQAPRLRLALTLSAWWRRGPK